MWLKEVITVPCATFASDEPSTSATGTQEDELRVWARTHVERVHRLKRDVAVFVLGMFVLTAIWMLVEWQDNGAFERLSSGSNPGDWDPWIFFVALIWGFFVALDALKAYFDRPATEAEIDRALGRLSRHA